MSNTPIEPLVDATKTAATHFAKAAFEVAKGIGALFVGISQTVRQEDASADPPHTRERIDIE